MSEGTFIHIMAHKFDTHGSIKQLFYVSEIRGAIVTKRLVQ